MQRTISHGRCAASPSSRPSSCSAPPPLKPLLVRRWRRTHATRSAVSVSAAQEALVLVPLVITQSSTMMTSAMQGLVGCHQALQASPRLALAAAGLLAMLQVLVQSLRLQSVEASTPGKQQSVGGASGNKTEPNMCGTSGVNFTSVTPSDVQRYLDLAKLRREDANKLIARLATYSIYLAIKESKPRLQRYLEAGELCRVREGGSSMDDADDPVAQLVSCRVGCPVDTEDGGTPLAADSGTVEKLVKEVAMRAAIEQINAVLAAVEASQPGPSL